MSNKIASVTPTNVVKGTKSVNLSGSGLVLTGPGYLHGIFVASTTSGTIKVWDNTAGSGTVLVNTFTPTAPGWYELPFAFSTGCYVTLANTIDITVSVS